MRIAVSIFVWLTVLFGGGCAIFEKETTNRGGYLDYVLDQHWLKADSKGMRALRAFAAQVSLARIASVAAKNDADRQLLAIRIGALTKRFLPVYACAFDTNPLGVAGAENDPCFYYDSAMLDYSTGLFDLAMIALPIDDAKKLVSSVTGSVVNPINIVDLLDNLLAIGRDAIKYGRVVGALYRDTIELEVQLWLATPAFDDRPFPYRVTEEHVAALREIYSRRNDDMPSWLGAIAALRSLGLEPLPQPKFFAELGGLMRYICDLITKDPDALSRCKTGLPTTLPSPASVLGSMPPLRVGTVITPNRIGTSSSGGSGRPGPSSSDRGPRPKQEAEPRPQPQPQPQPQPKSAAERCEPRDDTVCLQLVQYLFSPDNKLLDEPLQKLTAVLDEMEPRLAGQTVVVATKRRFADVRKRLLARAKTTNPPLIPANLPSGPSPSSPSPSNPAEERCEPRNDEACLQLVRYLFSPDNKLLDEPLQKLTAVLNEIEPRLAGQTVVVATKLRYVDLRKRLLARAKSMVPPLIPSN